MKKSLRERIFSLMKDGRPRTLFEIRQIVGGSDSGISAKLRDLRKIQYGGHAVESRCANRKEQIYKYRLTPRLPDPVEVTVEKARAVVGLEQQELFG